MQEACNVSAGMAVLKVERGTVVQVSDEFTDLTGFSESEANGRSIGEITRMLKADSQIELRTELYPDIARLAERRGGEGHR